MKAGLWINSQACFSRLKVQFYKILIFIPYGNCAFPCAFLLISHSIFLIYIFYLLYFILYVINTYSCTSLHKYASSSGAGFNKAPCGAFNKKTVGIIANTETIAVNKKITGGQVYTACPNSS